MTTLETAISATLALGGAIIALTAALCWLWRVLMRFVDPNY